MNPRELIEREYRALEEEARGIVADVAGPTPRYERLWVAADNDTARALAMTRPPRHPLAQIADILSRAAGAGGLVLVEAPEEDRLVLHDLNVRILAPSRGAGVSGR
jgi:hypothetical protein